MRPILFTMLLAAALSAGLAPPAGADPARIPGERISDDVYAGPIHDLLGSGDQLYALCGRDLRVYDIGTRHAPTFVTSIGIEGSWNGAVLGDVLATAECLVDITDPSAPRQTAVFRALGGRTMGRTGDFLFRSIEFPQDDQRISVLDISDREHPTHVTDIAGSPLFRMTDDGVLIRTVGPGLEFRDVTDPSTPVFLDYLPLIGLEPDLHLSVIDGDLLYLLEDGLWIVDISDPTDTAVIGSLDLHLWRERPPVVDGDRLYVSAEDVLHVIDVANPDSPRLLHTIPMHRPSEPDGVRIAAGNGLLCTGLDYELAIGDYADPHHPVTIMSDHLACGEILLGEVLGLAVFELCDGRVRIVDTKLDGLPSWTHDIGNPSWPSRMVGPYLLTGAWSRSVVFDISDPAAPVEVAAGVLEYGDGSYVTTDAGIVELDYDSVRGLELTDPSVPVVEWSLETDISSPLAATVLGDLLYVHAADVVMSYDFQGQTPGGMTGMTIGPFEGSALAEHADGYHVIYASRPGVGLEIIPCHNGVPDPTPFAVLDDFDPRAMQRHGVLLYVQNGDGGMRVYDVSDPQYPGLAGDFDLTGDAPADTLLGDWLVRDTDLIVGSNGRSSARVFKHLFSGVIANEPVDPGDVIPTALVLGSYPNPFNPRTTLSVDLPIPGEISLTVHDARGRRVGTVFRGARGVGRHVFEWDGTGDDGRALPSGVYMATVKTASGTRGVKMTLAR